MKWFKENIYFTNIVLKRRDTLISVILGSLFYIFFIIRLDFYLLIPLFIMALLADFIDYKKTNKVFQKWFGIIFFGLFMLSIVSLLFI